MGGIFKTTLKSDQPISEATGKIRIMQKKESSSKRKDYVIDTNVAIENPSCVTVLRNGSQNNVFVPKNVLFELDRLKKDSRISHVAVRAAKSLGKSLENGEARIIPQEARKGEALVNISTKVDDMFADVHPEFSDTVDMYILREILMSGLENPILVTNDNLFTTISRTLAERHGFSLSCEPLKDSIPFLPESKHYSGIIEEGDTLHPNSFRWAHVDGKKKLLWARPGGDVDIPCSDNALSSFKVWGVTPRNVYQRMALAMFLADDLPLVSVQSAAGYGKTFLALAAALHLVLQDKNSPYDRIIVTKPAVEVGREMGFLPGDLDDKMAPYMRNILDLAKKLHGIRNAARIFDIAKGGEVTGWTRFNSVKCEVLPLSIIRGMNIDNAVVVADEIQNMSRIVLRSFLTRMGENVKCICLGDTNQVDDRYLSEENNGMNWLVKCLKGNKGYGHLVLKGAHSRGPITDMVLENGL